MGFVISKLFSYTSGMSENDPSKPGQEGDAGKSQAGSAAEGGPSVPSEEKKKPMLEPHSVQTTSEWLKSLTIRDDAEKPEQLLEEVSFEGIGKYIQSGKCKNIVTMAGAGISTSSGIPDFRSPGSGLYDNLAKYDLPDPMAIFTIQYFEHNPEPFFQLCKELYPGTFKPTPCHYFIKLLQDKGLLLRHYTQNIDTLERAAGIDGDKIVEAHGTFNTSHCRVCGEEFSQDWMKEQIFQDKVPKCTEDDCEGVVKPDIVFFGEALPTRFFKCVKEDLPKCDLLIILGTSLVVQPFASLTNRVPDTTPRLYINLENTGGSGATDPLSILMFGGSGLAFESEDNYRDIFWQGTCDDGCYALANLLGMKKELEEMVKMEHARIEKEGTSTVKSTSQVKSDPDTSPSSEQMYPTPDQVSNEPSTESDKSSGKL